MNTDINGLIFCGFIFLILLILGFVLRSGHGAFLIGGYNILPKASKELFNEKALCRFFGNLVLLSDIIILLTIFAFVRGIIWLAITLVFVLITLSFIAIIYAFTGDRFKKQA